MTDRDLAAAAGSRQQRRARRERREWVRQRLAALAAPATAAPSPIPRRPRPWGFPRPVPPPERPADSSPPPAEPLPGYGFPGSHGIPGGSGSPRAARTAAPPRWQEATPAVAPAIVRLAAALPELGPVFCAFGRYLGTRLDLLPEAACRVLAAVPVRVPPMPSERVRELLGRELPASEPRANGLPPPLAALDPLPVATSLVYQEHRGRLAGGERVLVRLVRPELEAELADDLELLPLVGEALAAASQIGDPGGGAGAAGPTGMASLPPPAALAAAVDDFAGGYAGALAAADLSRQAAALLAAGQDGVAAGLPWCSPRLLPELSGSRVLTLIEPPGATLADLPREPGGPREAAELAIRLCQAWLRQACFGQGFAAAFGSGDARLLPDQRLAWTGGTFATLPPATKVNLWDYLLAAAADQPDRAGAALLRELDGGPDDGGSSLRHRLRQLVPFRDGGWAATDDLAGYLFLHWRCAAELGYRPPPHLAAFYRGLARLAAEARRLAPERDALREGLEAVRLTAGLGEVTRWLDREQLKEVLGSYAGVLLAMPQRVEELLNLAAAGRVNVKLEVVESEAPAGRRRQDAAAVSWAVLMAMAAVVLLAHQLAASGALGRWASWSERIAAVMVGVLGAFLLRGGAGRWRGNGRRGAGRHRWTGGR
jgi:hypothetical protein